ncbi:inter-alpha-trypsin inhibitor heavy chain H3-like [Tachyglossus aculeatus]|uniref:inter-alpha-trypsin inhibitor heavy chain H3-like n=1 Tax=Tachyglossus aculeatus TaxID=9261 RepID=UPI0018F70B74|nr:inter-alpha-trypsin inhibitor heavy chain H3-like [Tachyglossus aculeatus]
MDLRLLVPIWLAFIPGLPASDVSLSRPRNSGVINDVEIQTMQVNSKVTSRFAHNVITSRAVNHANVSKEIIFDVEIPKTAFISNFIITVDGIPYPGNIKDKMAARRQYQKAVSRGETAALVKASGRKMEKFTISVNIAAGSRVTFELTYEELLKRHLGKYEIIIKVKPKQLVNQFEIEADLFEPQGISMLEAQASFHSGDLSQVIEKSFSGNRGRVFFNPTVDQQQTCPTCSTSLLDGEFMIKYDVNRDTACDLQVVNKYFAHFFAPKNLKNIPKNVVFVIDISASMAGRKIRQTRDALLKILNDIRPEDYFNFILFGGYVKTWKQSLVKATDANLKEAKEFVQNFKIAGATSLNAGLLQGIEILNRAHETHPELKKNAPIVIMLTDGEPTVGEVRLDKIRENVRNAIGGKFPLYNLGFGDKVDFNFLEKMSLENNGVARRIYQENDAADQLQGFYDEVANPLLVDVELQYPQNSISALTQNKFKQYYDGSEIVVAGQINDNDLSNFKADMKARGVDKDLASTCLVDKQKMEQALHERGHMFEEHIERLWAYLTIQQLLAESIKAEGQEKDNLTAQALELSLKYKFVTPLTSMVVIKPGDPEDQALLADKPEEAKAKPSKIVLPAQYTPHHAAKESKPSTYQPLKTPDHISSVDGDPHFIIRVPDKEDALCFNINEEPGVVLNLIRDPGRGITVNGQLIGEQFNDNAKTKSTYLGKLGIVNQEMDLKLEVTPQTIILHFGPRRSIFSWLERVTLRQGGVIMTINRKRNLVLSMGDGATFVVVLHQVWKKNPVHQSFLGVYTLDSHKLSERTHGLLGQFLHPIDFEVFDVRPGSDPSKPDATMMVKNHKLTVTRGWQKDYRKDPRQGSEVSCWFVHNNGAGLIDGSHTDYIVPDILYQEDSPTTSL